MIKLQKQMAVIILVCLSSALLFSESKIKESSSFRLQGEIELWAKPDFNSECNYRTFNYEYGVEVRVIKIGKDDMHGSQKGKWLYVLLTAPQYVDTGEVIKKYTKFWIFLPDDTEVFDLEE